MEESVNSEPLGYKLILVIQQSNRSGWTTWSIHVISSNVYWTVHHCNSWQM